MRFSRERGRGRRGWRRRVSGGANEGTRKTRRGGEETDAIGCRVIRHPRHRDAERSRRTRQVTCWFAGGRRAVAACAGAPPAQTSRGVLGNDRATTYRLARTVPWPRRRRRGPSPARLPSRRARFCRESRTSASAVFHVARNPGSARATRRIERRGASMRRTVCVRRTRTSTRGANTARGSPAPHARLRSPGSSCRRTNNRNNRGCRFSSLPAGRA